MATKYSIKWFAKATLEQLRKERRKIELDYRNPKLNIEYRGKLWDLLHVFDVQIGNKQWDGKPYRYPVKSEHGTNLYKRN